MSPLETSPNGSESVLKRLSDSAASGSAGGHPLPGLGQWHFFQYIFHDLSLLSLLFENRNLSGFRFLKAAVLYVDATKIATAGTRDDAGTFKCGSGRKYTAKEGWNRSVCCNFSHKRAEPGLQKLGVAL